MVSDYMETINLTPTQEFLLMIMWQMKCLSDKCHTKSKKVIIQFFEELDHYVCDSYSQVVDNLYDLARNWKLTEPLIDGHGNFGHPMGNGESADPNYTEVSLSIAGVQYIKANSLDNMTKWDLLRKHNIFKP